MKSREQELWDNPECDMSDEEAEYFLNKKKVKWVEDAVRLQNRLNNATSRKNFDEIIRCARDELRIKQEGI